MDFDGHVDVINFRKYAGRIESAISAAEAEQHQMPGLLVCNPFTKDGLKQNQASGDRRALKSEISLLEIHHRRIGRT